MYRDDDHHHDGGRTLTPVMSSRREPLPGITTLRDLRTHLQWAIEVEHTTIPSYMCALYSLEPGCNVEAAEVLRSVLLEEMLHLALAANLLNAVGGRPELDSPRLMPGYPRTLPHSHPPLPISLAPFSPETLDLFLQIEKPSTVGAEPQVDCYTTIGQFYDAIRRGFTNLVDDLGETAVFCGDPARQISDIKIRGGHGRTREITDLATARAALCLIVDQGEGAAQTEVWDGDHDMFHPERDAVGHYYRFLQLRIGRRFRRGDTPCSGPSGDPVDVDWSAVRPMRIDTRLADIESGSPAHEATESVNRIYCDVLAQLEATVNGRPDMLGPAIASMFRLEPAVEKLLRIRVDDSGTVAGPSFEWVRPEDRR